MHRAAAAAAVRCVAFLPFVAHRAHACTSDPYGRPAMRDATGQATIEWVGLVLVAALALGAVAAFRAPAQDRSLGTLIAQRITCAAAAEGMCAPAAGAPAVRPAVAPPAPTRVRSVDGAVARAGAPEALERLRGLGKWGGRVWMVCLAYRRYIFERDHRLDAIRGMPLEEAVDIADECLNPLSFLGGD